ncbi:MAG: amino acid adenylation domain-containing protein, partial [Acidimicrobiia bacterium]
IKSRGHRIELGDIETAMGGLGYLLDAVVVAIPDSRFGSLSVSCAYIPRDSEEVNPARIRGDLSAMLPSYMIPTGWCEFTSFPKNANGKIDRIAIQDTIETETAT